MPEMFMFAPGVENSSPTIENGRVRVDEMESCGHYQQWRLDFDKVQELGFISFGTEFRCTESIWHRSASTGIS